MNSITAQSQNTQFEIYGIYSVLNGLLGESLDPYEVHLQGDEFGIDGIAVTIQGEIVRTKEDAIDKLTAIKSPTIEFMFFQAKSGTGYDYGEISKFFDAVKFFFTCGLVGESTQ